MEHCKTCKWRDQDGFCQNGKLQESNGLAPQPDQMNALIYSYEESGKFWVGPEFGCVHHSHPAGFPFASKE